MKKRWALVAAVIAPFAGCADLLGITTATVRDASVQEDVIASEASADAYEAACPGTILCGNDDASFCCDQHTIKGCCFTLDKCCTETADSSFVAQPYLGCWYSAQCGDIAGPCCYVVEASTPSATCSSNKCNNGIVMCDPSGTGECDGSCVRSDFTGIQLKPDDAGIYGQCL